jgi:TP901 family phage tail tape measure protein
MFPGAMSAAGGGVVGGAVVRLLLDSSHFEHGLATSQSKLAAFGRGMSSVGSSLTRNISVPLAGIAATAVTMAFKFEDAFTRISAVSNASRKDISQWRGEILQLAGQTAKSPHELADALYFLASAGLKAGSEMKALRAAARGSAVGLGETADLARITANALNAYARSGLTATQVMDTLTAAVKAGTAESDEFSTALGRILPIASRAGVSFQEVTASLAALSNIGLDVNEGVTAMRGVLQALVAPGTLAAKTLKDIGISTDEMRRVLREGGLLDALQLLEQRTGGNIDVLRKIIPNIRAMTGELGLTGENAATVGKIFDQVKDSSGALGKAFDETASGPAFKARQALARLQAAAVTLGEKLLPVAERVVEWISNLADKFSRLSPEMQDNIIKWGAMAIALGPAVRLLGGIAQISGAVIGALRGIATGASSAAGSFFGPIGLIAALTAFLGFTAPGHAIMEHMLEPLFRAIGLLKDIPAKDPSQTNRPGPSVTGGTVMETLDAVAGHGAKAALSAGELQKAADKLAGAFKDFSSAAEAQDAFQRLTKEQRGLAAALLVTHHEMSALHQIVGGRFLDALVNGSAKEQELAISILATNELTRAQKQALVGLLSGLKGPFDSAAAAAATYDARLRGLPKDVRTYFFAHTDQATRAAIKYRALLYSLPSTINTRMYATPVIDQPNRVAAGGILRAQAGLVRQPTMVRSNVMAGEGNYWTPFGAGAEGIIPLTPAVLRTIGKEIAAGIPRGKDSVTVVPVVFSDDLDKRTRRTVRNSLIGVR